MLRVVLDTNVIVSALILKGTTNQLVRLWKEKKILPLISKTIAQEYLRVFAYPKFELSKPEIKYLMEEEILPFAEPIQVLEIPNVIKEDPSDNAFLGCALAGRARYLVSGDNHLLSLKNYKDTLIVSVAEFLTKEFREK